MMTTRPSTVPITRDSRLDPNSRKPNCAAATINPSYCEDFVGSVVKTDSETFYSSISESVRGIVPALKPITSMVSPSRAPAPPSSRPVDACLREPQADSRDMTLPCSDVTRKFSERRLEGVPEAKGMSGLGLPVPTNASGDTRISRRPGASRDELLAAIIQIQTAWRRFIAARDLDLRLLTHCLMAIRRVAVISVQRVWRGRAIRRVINEELGCVVFRWPLDEAAAEDDRRSGRLHTRQADAGKVIFAASTAGDPATRGSRAISRPRKVLCNLIQFVPDLSGRPSDQQKPTLINVSVTGNFLKQPWSDLLKLQRCRIRNCYVVAVPKARLLSHLPIDGTSGECVVIFKFVVDQNWRCNTWHFDTVKDPHGNDNNVIFLRAAVPFPPEPPYQRTQPAKLRKQNDKSAGLLI